MEKLKSEALLGRQVQQHLLRTVPQLERFDIAAAMHPLGAAGADFYDFVHLSDGSLGIVIGDVPGHGIGRALRMATILAYFRVLAKLYPDPGKVLSLVNKMLITDLESQFITLFFARLDPKTATVNCSDAGRGICWLFRRSGAASRLPDTKNGGPPLGVVPDYDYGVSQTVALGAGDILLLATDGLIECPTPGLGLFGFDRVLKIVRLNRERSASDIIGALFAAAQPLLLHQSHTERIHRPTVVGENALHKVDECCSDIPMLPDDMTAVVIKVK